MTSEKRLREIAAQHVRDQLEDIEMLSIVEADENEELSEADCERIIQMVLTWPILELPAPDGAVEAMSADGIIGEMVYWGHKVDVEAMRDPNRPGKGAITLFGRQLRNPRETAMQILAAVDYLGKEES